MTGDDCICGAAIWHPACYRSFSSYYSDERKCSKENIREWKEAHDFKENPRFTVTRKNANAP